MSVVGVSWRGQRVCVVEQAQVAGTVLGLDHGWEGAVVHVEVEPASGMCFDLRCWCCWGLVVVVVVRVWGRGRLVLVLVVAVAVVVVVVD